MSDMKKLFLIFVIIFWSNFVNAQWQYSSVLKSDIINVVDSGFLWTLPIQNNINNKMNFQTHKSTTWYWDTIISLKVTDTLHKYRYTRVYDLNANILEDVFEEWIANNWEYTYKYQFTYNPDGTQLTCRYFQWNNSAWKLNGRDTSMYYPGGMTCLGEGWQDSVWVNGTRTNYTYDSNGNGLTYVLENWQDSIWIYYDSITYTYDLDGNLLTYLYEIGHNDTLANQQRITYTYDGNGNNLNYTSESWNSILCIWETDFRVNYNYDSNGNVLYMLSESWQNNTWVNGMQKTYTYDTNNNLLTYLEEFWQTTYWKNYGRIFYTYDINGNRLGEIQQVWQSNSTWSNSFKTDFVYDAFGNSISGKQEQWSSNNWIPGHCNSWQAPLFSQRSEIYHISSTYRYNASFISFYTTGYTNNDLNKELINVFPNPVSNYITVFTPKESVIEILNIKGQIIKSVFNKATLTFIDMTDLSSGVYIVRVMTDKEVITKKIIKE
jgi:hypothetical protein